jgi:hypothetical protein
MNMMISMAWRNIWRNKVRSVVIMISIALGLVAGLFIMGLYEAWRACLSWAFMKGF